MPSVDDLSLSKGVRDTANLIASSRAALSDRYPLFVNDTYAKLFTNVSTEKGGERSDKSLGRIGCRTRFFDCFINEGVHGDLNAEQVLILASGFDTRCLRLRSLRGVKVFEIDQQESIESKERIMKEAGYGEAYNSSSVRVGGNLLEDGWIRELREKGFDPRKRTCIIAEGLLYYFDRDDALGLLRRVREDLVNEGVDMSFCFSAVTKNCIGGMKGLFRWGSDDIEGDARGCGWEGCRGFALTEWEGGGRSFGDYLARTKGVEQDLEADKYLGKLKDGEGKPKKTYWVTAFSRAALGTSFSDPKEKAVRVKEEDDDTINRQVIIVLGKELTASGDITGELKGRVLRALQLNDTLSEKGETKLLFSGGKGECEKMREFGVSVAGGDAVKEVLCEEASNTTIQNAACALDVVEREREREGWGEHEKIKIWVVTSSYHVRRAVDVMRREVKARGEVFWGVKVRAFGDFFAIPEDVDEQEYNHWHNA